MNIKFIIGRLFERILKPVFSVGGLMLNHIGALDKFVIIKMDGGLCSQMHFYMIGKMIEEKGIKVKYNIDFFKYYGLDVDGKFSRNFDLLKAFPNIDFEIASRWSYLLYTSFSYKTSILDMNHINPPMLLNGYYEDSDGFYDRFFKIFFLDEKLLDNANKEMLEYIKTKANSVAIHVRRGDLSGFNPTYGPPVDYNYFNRAIAFVEGHTTKGHYFIFSDDTTWVREHLIEKLNIDTNYTVVDINGSDKGYMDLFLMASCNHQISSKGSFGKYAGFLKHSDLNIITVCNDEYENRIWKNQSKNIVFV